MHSWMVLLCLALLLVPSYTSTCRSQQTYYVRPTSAVTCPAEPCLTLDQIRADPDTYITSNTLFKLLPGQHEISGDFTLANVECITIEGGTNDNSNPRTQIANAGRSRFNFVFTNAAHVFVAGIEHEVIGISLTGTQNVTLHRVVIDGSLTAISLRDTIDTNISHCQVRNTGWTGLTLYGTHHTIITNTFVNNTRWSGIGIVHAQSTLLYECVVNSTSWNGIDISHSNLTLISHVQVNSTGWQGIEVYRAKETTVIDTVVNNTGWNGIELTHTQQTAIIQTVIANTEWNGIDISRANRTDIHDVSVINPNWCGVDLCNVLLVSIKPTTVQGGYRCFNQCSPHDPLLEMQVECLP